MANYVSKDGLLYFWTLIKAKLDGKSNTGHTHTSSEVTDLSTTVKGIKVDNATTADTANSVAWANTNHPSTFTPSAHNQASSTINAMTGYTKPDATSAIATSDTLNAAIGKLEKALDGKQASGSYAASSHNQASSTINAMTGYSKASSAAAIAATDSLNTAIGKLEKGLDGKQASGTYVTASSATSVETTLTATSDTKVPSSKAIANYIAGLGFQTSGSYVTAESATSVETTLTTNSDAKVPTSKAIATYVTGLGYKTTDNDTKNTAGSTDTSSKIFLVGATSQAANPQTYSHDTAYVGTDGCLYSGGTKVLTSHQSLSNYYTKTEIDTKLTSAMRYKGSVAAYANLPTTDLTVGDMYNITATGANYVWDGSAWDETGMVVDLSPYALSADLVAVTNTEIDTIVAS